MELNLAWQFFVEASRLDGELLGDYPLPAPDFEPLLRAAHLAAMRRGATPVSTRPPAAELVPVTCPQRGAPYVTSIEILFSGAVADTFPLAVFNKAIAEGSSELVDRGLLVPGEQFTFRVYVAPKEPADPAPASADFELEAEDKPLQVWSEALPPMPHACVGSELPVLFRQPVLDEAVALSRATPEQEVGGLLLGRLCCDPELNDLSLDISALVAATEAVGTETSLRFSPATFAHLEQVLELRGRGETVLGWFHSHPHFCRACPESRRADCLFGRPFFSEADRSVHRALFPQAYSIALLISDLGEPAPSVDLFSWQRGAIERRAFAVTDEPVARDPCLTAMGKPNLTNRQQTGQQSRHRRNHQS